MAVSRYVTLRAIKHSGNDFAAGTPVALSDEYAAPLLAIGAIQAQAGALPVMPTAAGSVVRESLDTGSGARAKTYVEVTTSEKGPTFSSDDASTKIVLGGNASVFGPKGRVTVQDPAITGRVDTVALVYGANIGGIAFALRARKYGRRVVLIHPTNHLGGMTTGGLSFVDVKDTDQINYGPVMQDYFTRCAAEYGMTLADYWTVWKYAVEPKVADKVVRAMLAEKGVLLITGGYPIAATKTGAVGASVEFAAMDGMGLPFTVHSKYWFDDSDEHDLSAVLGVTLVSGREASADFGESLAGVQAGQSLGANISAYKVAGDSASGLVNKFVLSAAPGTAGAATPYLQAYNYRVICTNNPANRVPFPEPENYDPMWYEPIGRCITAKGTANLTLADVLANRPIPNGKADWNNKDDVILLSTDCIGGNAGYLTGSWDTRNAIIKDNREWWFGFIKWLKTDPRVTGTVKAELEQWGLCADEFPDTGHMSPVMYVRTGRRARGVYVHTQADVMGTAAPKHGVVYANYGADSHFCTLYADGSGYLRKEGWYYQNPPYRHVIQYGSLVPLATECTNLFFGGLNLSATAVAVSSIRMEPQRGWVGQVAADAMEIAIVDGIANVQDVPLAKLQGKSGLTHGGIILSVDCPAENGTVDVQPSAAGWTRASAISGGTGVDFYGRYYYSSGGVGGNNVNKYIRYKPNIGANGQFRVYVKFPRNPAGTGRASNQALTIVHAGGTTNLTVDTRAVGDWYDAGVFTFNAGTPSVHYVDVKTTGSDNNVVGNVVEFVAQ